MVLTGTETAYREDVVVPVALTPPVVVDDFTSLLLAW